MTLTGLLVHVDEHYSEYQLRYDLDCVLTLCPDDRTEAEVRKLAGAKLKRLPYRPPVDGVARPRRESACEWCLYPNPGEGRFCSPRCEGWAAEVKAGPGVFPRPVLPSGGTRTASAVRMVRCPECPKVFGAARASRKYCSARCRQRAQRKQGAPVTL